MLKKAKPNLIHFTIASIMISTIVSTLPTKTIAQYPTETALQECTAADWPSLKKEIDKRYKSLEASLDDMVEQVKTDGIPEANINSQEQINAIDSLLNCLNSPRFSPTLSPQKEQAVQSLTNFKNNILNRAKDGLVNNDDGKWDNKDDFYSLKLNLKLAEELAQVSTIGNDFITAFEGAIETFTNDVSSQISQLDETLPPSPALPPPNNPAPNNPGGNSLKLEIWQTILLILGGLFSLGFVILKLSPKLPKEVHFPLLSSKGKWKPEAAQDLSGEEMDELGDIIGYLKQKIDNLERQTQAKGIGLSREISSLKSQINQINERFNIIETNLSDLKELISKNESNQNLSYQQEALNQEIFNLKSQLNEKFKIVGKALSKLIDTSTDRIDQPLQSSPKINHQRTIAPPPTPSISQSSKPKPISKSLQASSKTPQNLPSQLIDTYNTNTDLLKSIAMGVAETESSFTARRSSLQMPMIFEPNANQPRFWILNDRILVPFPQKITTHRLNTICGAFNHHDFSSGSPFELVKPAIVIKMSDGSDRWQLLEKGEIKFIPIPESVIDN